jgi:mRNA degradation ribonuclease J1/J2
MVILVTGGVRDIGRVLYLVHQVKEVFILDHL